MVELITKLAFPPNRFGTWTPVMDALMIIRIWLRGGWNAAVEWLLVALRIRPVYPYHVFDLMQRAERMLAERPDYPACHLKAEISAFIRTGRFHIPD